MDPALVLSAPNAALMAELSKSIFQNTMDWTMFLLGAGVAVVVILIDLFLQRRKSVWRLHVLGVAVGIYMPLFVMILLCIGGLISFFADRVWANRAELIDNDPLIQAEAANARRTEGTQ